MGEGKFELGGLEDGGGGDSVGTAGEGERGKRSHHGDKREEHDVGDRVSGADSEEATAQKVGDR